MIDLNGVVTPELLARAKLEAELQRVISAKTEMQLTVIERQFDIERLKTNIAIQEKRIKELNDKLTGGG